MRGGVVWRRPGLPSPLRSTAAGSGRGALASGGAGRCRSGAPAAQVRRREEGACVLVSEPFHVESTSVCVCLVYLICEEVTGVSCSNPVGRGPLICFPGCHYRHFQNLIPKRTRRLGFTLRAHT